MIGFIVPGDSGLRIPRKRGQCLAVFYSNIIALNTKIFTRYLRTHYSKQIHTKKPHEKLLGVSKSHKTSVNLSDRAYFWQYIDW